MKRCLYCDSELVRKYPNANNVKYCSPRHRELHYAETGKRYTSQRRYTDKKHTKQFPGSRQCHVCKLWFRAVCHHAWQMHGMDEREYKRIAGLDHKKGLIPETLKEIKARHVFENKTYTNLVSGKSTRFVKNDPRAGRYKRSPQTMNRLKKRLFSAILPNKDYGKH